MADRHLHRLRRSARARPADALHAHRAHLHHAHLRPPRAAHRLLHEPHRRAGALPPGSQDAGHAGLPPAPLRAAARGHEPRAEHDGRCLLLPRPPRPRGRGRLRPPDPRLRPPGARRPRAALPPGRDVRPATLPAARRADALGAARRRGPAVVRRPHGGLGRRDRPAHRALSRRRPARGDRELVRRGPRRRLHRLRQGHVQVPRRPLAAAAARLALSLPQQRPDEARPDQRGLGHDADAPALPRAGGRDTAPAYVAITDNADPMDVVVYRAGDTLARRQARGVRRCRSSPRAPARPRTR